VISKCIVCIRPFDPEWRRLCARKGRKHSTADNSRLYAFMYTHTHLYIEFCHVYFFFVHPRKIGFFFHRYFAPRLQFKIQYNILHSMLAARRLQRRRLLIIYLLRRRSINTRRVLYVSISENIIVDFIIATRRVRSRPRSPGYIGTCIAYIVYDIIVGSATDLTLFGRVRHNIMNPRTTIGLRRRLFIITEFTYITHQNI